MLWPVDLKVHYERLCQNVAWMGWNNGSNAVWFSSCIPCWAIYLFHLKNLVHNFITLEELDLQAWIRMSAGEDMRWGEPDMY